MPHLPKFVWMIALQPWLGVCLAMAQSDEPLRPDSLKLYTLSPGGVECKGIDGAAYWPTRITIVPKNWEPPLTGDLDCRDWTKISEATIEAHDTDQVVIEATQVVG
jgi:hypothetical protein